VIAEGCVLYAQCYVGHGTHLGADCLIYPQVVLRENISLGKRVIIHSGTVIGSDGFGYDTVDGKHVKIPQVGSVLIEDDVEIGANVTIDRARFDRTVIGEGTKIDNLVQIAHNVITGKHCFIVSQSGVAGSTQLGNYVILAAQAGLVGHIEIGDGAIVAAQSGVSHSIKAGEQVFGSPAQPIKKAFRNNAHVQRLDKYVETIKDLKKRTEELEKKIV
jgi:UDP-3-O-[3-hydroxymyristoyl] glucosamine N-acyltransferase